MSPEFSSRFSATWRTYRYFFAKRNLDIEAMRVAASRLVGNHDFRNFAKLDVANVTNFRRDIYSAEIKKADFVSRHMGSEENDDSLTIYMLEIKGIAFLWHMVRCIMAILTLVGERAESPSIVEKLLDIHQVMPRKY